MNHRRFLAALLLATTGACGSVDGPEQGEPAGSADAGVDAGVDRAIDAGSDVGIDAGGDAGGDGPDSAVDPGPPDTYFVEGPATPDNSLQATFIFEASKPNCTFRCQLDDNDWSDCVSPVELDVVGQGAHRFSVVATDPAGQTDPSQAVYDWMVDTIAPEVTISNGPASPSNIDEAAFVFSASEASDFTCSIDDEPAGECESPFPAVDMAEGAHSLEIVATDAAGNKGTADYGWVVDLSVPAVEIVSGPDARTNVTTATLTFTVDDGAVATCALDEQPFAACDSETAMVYSGLAANVEHIAYVRATDGAGNSSTATYEWFIDTVAPSVSIVSGPSGWVNNTTATFTFSCNDSDATFQCQHNGGTWANCSSPERYTEVADGRHEFIVRAVDRANNTSTARSRSWSVDTTKPLIRLLSGPSSPTNAISATFSFSSDDDNAEFWCQLNSNEPESCDSGKIYARLTDGTHTFRVYATDRAGNASAGVSHSWTIDTTAPSIVWRAYPDARDPSSEVTFGFVVLPNESVTFECGLDGARPMTCESGVTYSGIAPGQHSFKVNATDTVGNVGSRTYTWERTR